MKLNRENFIKMEHDGGMLYKYVCNETDFFLHVKGRGARKEISVFKGNVDNRIEEFKTNDSLEAWNRFEEMLKVCEPEQGSSGGFKKNPQETPQILPLLAVKQDGGGYNVILFGQLTNGEQITAFDFFVSADALTYPFPNKVFSVDWSNEEIPALVKCEVIMKQFPDVKFKEDEERDVFLFIPKSIMQQGGEKGGETEGEPDGEGEPTGGDDGTPSYKKGEPKDGKDGKPDDKEPKQPTDGGTPSDKKGEPKDGEDGKPDDEDDTDEGGSQPTSGSGEKLNPEDVGKGENSNQPIDYPEAVQTIARIAEVQPSTITRMRTAENLETLLLTSNFSAIKSALNLPANMTAIELSQQLINSRN
jgi:hypothetical protein